MIDKQGGVCFFCMQKNWKKTVIIGSVSVPMLIVLAVGVHMYVQNRPSKEWFEMKATVLPQLVQSDHKEQVPIVHQELSPEIDIAFVIDESDSYTFIMEKDLLNWNITEERLLKTALKNLDVLVKDTEISIATAGEDPKERYAIIETGDGYDAAKLLSNAVRRRIAADLGDVFVAAIPFRDFLVFWSEDFSLEQQFLSQVQQEFDAEETYKLTPNPFLVSIDVIQPLRKETPTSAVSQ